MAEDRRGIRNRGDVGVLVESSRFWAGALFGCSLCPNRSSWRALLVVVEKLVCASGSILTASI
jgi:hypothetical protein